jgi:hypothetical protein
VFSKRYTFILISPIQHERQRPNDETRAHTSLLSRSHRIKCNVCLVSEMSSFHSGEYEAQNLLGCAAVFLIECRPTFHRYVRPPTTGR